MRLKPNVLTQLGAVAFQFTRKRGLADFHDTCDLFSWAFSLQQGKDLQPLLRG